MPDYSALETNPIIKCDIPQCELIVLDTITNMMGKAMVPIVGWDWVDVNVINPNEHYMMEYIERLLRFIAIRLKV